MLESGILQWAASSVGRAPRSQRGGREFEPPAVHQLFLSLLVNLSPHRFFRPSRCAQNVPNGPGIRRDAACLRASDSCAYRSSNIRDECRRSSDGLDVELPPRSASRACGAAYGTRRRSVDAGARPTPAATSIQAIHRVGRPRPRTREHPRPACAAGPSARPESSSVPPTQRIFGRSSSPGNVNRPRPTRPPSGAPTSRLHGRPSTGGASRGSEFGGHAAISAACSADQDTRVRRYRPSRLTIARRVPSTFPHSTAFAKMTRACRARDSPSPA